MATGMTVVTPEQRDLEVIEVSTTRVACDGGGGPLGHPLTYYEVSPEIEAVCGYCGKRFVWQKN